MRQCVVVVRVEVHHLVACQGGKAVLDNKFPIPHVSIDCICAFVLNATSVLCALNSFSST